MTITISTFKKTLSGGKGNKRPRELYALFHLLPDETDIALRVMGIQLR